MLYRVQVVVETWNDEKTERAAASGRTVLETQDKEAALTTCDAIRDEAARLVARRRAHVDPSKARCVCCGIRWVDVENGYDTCAVCLNAQ